MSDSEEIRDLLDEGLTHYGLGEVQKALGVWKRVLELEPGNPRAMEYIRFVEENWAPNQDRGEESYRPDEGTDPKAKAKGEGQAAGEADQRAPGAEGTGSGTGIQDTPGADSEADPGQVPADYVPPVKSQDGNWGDLYDFNKVAATPPSGAGADPEPAPAPVSETVPVPAPASDPVPEPIPEPVSARIPGPIPEPAAQGPASQPSAAPASVDLPPEAEGDEGFARWDSKVWTSEPPPSTGSSLPDVPEEQVEKIESSTLPARPEPPPEQAPAAPAPDSASAGDAPQDSPATDGWGTLGAPVKTDPELRIDPGLQSAFSRPPSEPGKLVLQPAPPFSDSMPPPVDSLPVDPSLPLDASLMGAESAAPLPADSTADDPLFDGSLPAALDLSENEDSGSAPTEAFVDLSGPAADVDLERFSLDTTPPPAGPSALGLVGGGGMTIEDDAPGRPGAFGSTEVSGEFDSVTALMLGVNDMLELDDFSGAVELLDKVLDQDPDHAEAARLREEAEGELIKMYESKIGDLARTPEVRMASDEIIWLNLDHRAGFLLSMIDGQTSYEDLMAVSGLPQLDVLRILVQLLQEKVIDVS